MFTPTLRLRFAVEKMLTTGQNEQRPCVLHAMIATERWRRVLCRDGPVNDGGRENPQRDDLLANNSRDDDSENFNVKNCSDDSVDERMSGTRLSDGINGAGIARVDSACRHEFVKSCFANLCHIGSKTCIVCENRIWAFWKSQTCVDCGVKKHDGCVLAETATGEIESASSERDTSQRSPGDDQIVSGDRTPANALPACVRDASPGSAVEKTTCSSDGAVGPAYSGQRVRVTTTPPAPLGASVFEKIRAAEESVGETRVVVGDCELPGVPKTDEVPVENTKTVRTAVSVAGANETAVSADRPVAIGNDDRSPVADDPIVRRSPTVREENIKLFTKCKMLPRNNARWEISNYMKKVNRYLNKPQEQMSVDHLIKYWIMQNRLFSRFSMGIILDEESFFSVCPEVLCSHIANKCRCETIVDPFCGAGGNIIQFTKTCSRVIGIDADYKKIKLARNNAKVYGVQNRLQLRTGDYFQRDEKLKADVVFMSPPWGGPEYINEPVYSLAGMCLENGGGRRILEIARKIAPKIAIRLPRNLDKNECVMIARDLNFKYVLFENNYIGNKLNSTTMYLK